MNWVRSSLTDISGAWDIAYVSLGAVMLTVIISILTMTAMSVAAYFSCSDILNKDGSAVLKVCVYDPQPLGFAIGATCGGFATALAALAGYMAATRRPINVDSRTPTP